MDIDQKMTGQFNYRLVLKWIIVFAIFVFLGKMVWDNWNQVKDVPFTLPLIPFILSILIFAFSYFIQIWAWYLITLKLKIAVSFPETIKSWFYSQLGKYLPGKVWLLLSRFYFYESKGMSRKGISVALYLEMVAVIVAAALIFLASLIFLNEIELFCPKSQFLWLVPGFILVAFIFLHPWVLQKILNWVLVRLSREPISLSISYLDVLWILFICVVAWLVGGIGFYLFVDSMYPSSTPIHFILNRGPGDFKHFGVNRHFCSKRVGGQRRGVGLSSLIYDGNSSSGDYFYSHPSLDDFH